MLNNDRWTPVFELLQELLHSAELVQESDLERSNHSSGTVYSEASMDSAPGRGVQTPGPALYWGGQTPQGPPPVNGNTDSIPTPVGMGASGKISDEKWSRRLLRAFVNTLAEVNALVEARPRLFLGRIEDFNGLMECARELLPPSLKLAVNFVCKIHMGSD